MCRAKFLAVKEDFMLLAVGIISTSAFVLNPEHWKQVPSFLNKLAPHGGEKKEKGGLFMCFSTAGRPAGYGEGREGGDPFQFIGWKRARLGGRVMAQQFSRGACARAAASLSSSCFSFCTARMNPERHSFAGNQQ